MNLKDKITKDIKDAMRSKNELRLSVLRMLSSAIHNREIEKRAKTGKEEELNEEEVVANTIGIMEKIKDAKTKEELKEIVKGLDSSTQAIFANQITNKNEGPKIPLEAEDSKR